MEQLIFNPTAKAIRYGDIPNKCKELYELIIERKEQEEKYGLDPWSYKDYAKYLNCTTRTISRHVKALKELGLITVQRVNGFVTEYFLKDIIGSKFHEQSRHQELFVSIKNKPEQNTKEEHKYESVLDSSQLQLKAYIEKKLNIHLSDKKVLILIEEANANTSIDNKERFKIIMQCTNKAAEYNPINPFGYLKKLIKTFTEEQENVKAVPEQKDTLEYEDIAKSLSYKLEWDYDKSYHLSVKQCNALISVAVKRCGIAVERTYNFILFDIISQIRNLDIKDMFAYIRVMILGFQQNC